MKIENINYIWVLIDEFGDVNTEFFFPEIEKRIVPREAVKLLDDSHPDSKLQRLEIIQK